MSRAFAIIITGFVLLPAVSATAQYYYPPPPPGYYYDDGGPPRRNYRERYRGYYDDRPRMGVGRLDGITFDSRGRPACVDPRFTIQEGRCQPYRGR